MSAETALVTGGGGFLGRHVVRLLREAGHTVRVLGRHRYPELEALGAECRVGDLSRAEDVRQACEGVDVVHHVAALAGAWGDTRAFERANVHGTEHVIAACRAAGVPRLVATSSPSVVGAGHEGADESVPYAKEHLADYPRTKAQAEQAVLAANCLDLRTVALRPHLIFGPGDPHLLPRVIARARQGKLRIVGGGENRVDLTRVENAARAQLLAAEALKGTAPAAGKAYFISNGEPVPLWPWVNRVLEALGLQPVRRRISREAALRFGATLERTWRLLSLGGEPPMTRFVATQLASSHWFDIGAARRDLGYDPSAHPMAEGEAALIRWYREGLGRWSPELTGTVE